MQVWAHRTCILYIVYACMYLCIYILMYECMYVCIMFMYVWMFARRVQFGTELPWGRNSDREWQKFNGTNRPRMKSLGIFFDLWMRLSNTNTPGKFVERSCYVLNSREWKQNNFMYSTMKEAIRRHSGLCASVYGHNQIMIIYFIQTTAASKLEQPILKSPVYDLIFWPFLCISNLE